ncbi:IclR family transcriptional regulator [Litorisediminicola beolgyonensis]|uniref:IclR family transcriptional regulator n=1 Tax=Litorisediminicola beolgyonensis TaxID=1173614 RepID=A0ABW3ZK25_9RHOB
MNHSARSKTPETTDFSANDEDRLFVRSAARAFQVLSAFNEARGPMSLSEIAQAAQLDRSAAQRLVHTLRKLGYLRRSEGDRGYLPGLPVLDHTLDMLRLDPLVQRATPVLLELRKTIKERIDLSLFDRTRMVYALRMQSKRETFYATLVGHSVPSYCTAGGRAALSALPRDEAAEIVQASDLDARTKATLTDPEAILAAIDDARRDGYAVVREEYVLGEIALGLPLVINGKPMGAIHVAGSLSEWEPEGFVHQLAPFAMEASRAITAGF